MTAGGGEGRLVVLTGATGFLGSHLAEALLDDGWRVRATCRPAGDRQWLADRPVEWRVSDLTSADDCRELLRGAHTVVHCAGVVAALDELAYTRGNVDTTAALLKAGAYSLPGDGAFVLVSSLAAHGPAGLDKPAVEDDPCRPITPYGRSKLIVEDILADLHHADPTWRIARLRYFNPVGAHESGLIGEDPLANNGIPNNLLPFVAQVASGQREFLNAWGNDYPTPDGTGVLDYIHVDDLADGHVAALSYLAQKGGPLTVNLGTGQGYSVIDMIKAFEQASGRPIPYKIAPRRFGDIAECWADPSLARQLLGWTAKRGLAQMCSDAWRWQQSSQAFTANQSDQ